MTTSPHPLPPSPGGRGACPFGKLRASAERSEGVGGEVFTHLVLVGLSGSGKSTVGRLLAEQLGRPFVDTDDLITA
ncbi:MAG: shikimate kinase, partial [Chloroflexota bacterium]